MNRKPTNPEALAAATQAWLKAAEKWSMSEGHDFDEDDLPFEAALRELGVVGPDEIIDELNTDARFKWVCVTVAAEDASFIIYADGTIVNE